MTIALIKTKDRYGYISAAIEYGVFLRLPTNLYQKEPPMDAKPKDRRKLIIKLTPGRCSACGRFMRKDIPPDVWSVDVAPEYQQVPGQPNIWARTRCEDCRYVGDDEDLSYARGVPMSVAIARARLLGQPTS